MRAKCFSFTTGLLFLTTTTCAAFTWSGGIKAGINLATLSGRTEYLKIDYGTQPGFTGGGFLQLNPESVLSGQFELLYTQKGGDGVGFKNGWESSKPFDSLRLHYLDVPLLARIRLLSRRSPLYLLAGPVFSIRLNSSLQLSIGDGSPRDYDWKYIDEIDLGVLGGVGFEWKRFLAEIRYDYGFSDNRYYYIDYRVKNRGLALLGGCKF